MLEDFEKIGKKAFEALKNLNSAQELEQFRIKFLAKKGQVTQMLSQLGKMPPEQRKQAGQLLSELESLLPERVFAKASQSGKKRDWEYFVHNTKATSWTEIS